MNSVSVSLLEPLSNHTTLRIGGPAEVFVRVMTEEALQQVMSMSHEESLPVQILGQGSNVLVPDEGIPGLVLVLDGAFNQYHFSGDRVDAGGSVVLARLAKQAAQRDLVGLEALAGFPSTVGGAVVMNAGCYGVEIQELIVSVVVIEPGGERRCLQPGDLEAGYRRTRLLGGSAIVARALLRLRAGNGREAMETMATINRKRRSSMPSGFPNAGSVFKNPPGDFAGRLIEGCGLKGARHGGAQISDRHANVIVNLGGASADDVLSLMAMAYHEVKSRHEVDLEPELVLAGTLKDRWLRAVSGTSNG